MAPRQLLPHLTIVLVLVLAISVGAIGINRATGPRGHQTGTTALPVLHWANEGVSDLFSLDPARGPDYNSMLAGQLVFGGLVRFSPDFRILPDAAATWEVSADGRTYTFHLRPGVRFGDGTPLSAADVAFSFNRLLSPAFASQSNGYLLSPIEGADAVIAGTARQANGIRVIDSQTLRITLRFATGSFLARLATQAGWIVPSWRIKANPTGWDRHAIGTGPFMVSRWVPGVALQLVPNPHYFGGAMHIGGIDMPFIPEPLVAYKHYRSGAVDIMGTVHFPSGALYETKDQPDFHRSATLETVYLTLNTRTPPFNSALVRQAFAHALDKNAVVRQVYENFAHPTDGMLPPGILGYNPRQSGAAFNPTLARALLAAAGYPNGRGLPPITYVVDQDAQSLVLASNLAAQWRRALGVHVTLRQQNHSTYLMTLSNDAYQLAVIDWTRDYPDPQNFLSQLLHSGSPNNNGNWRNATFDAIVDRADHMIAADPMRLALYRQAESIAMNDAAAIPLVNPTIGILLRQNIHGLLIAGGQVLAPDWTRVTISSEQGT